MGMFHELDAAIEGLSGLSAAVLATAAMVPSLSADRAKEYREGVRRLVQALRDTADTIERVTAEASERRPS